MNEPSINPNPISDRSGITDAVRVQILSTEHWSLLATRSMGWNEVFSRASMFITLLSSVVVALALVAQAIGFGPQFRIFALLVLPIVLLLGITTFVRLNQSNTDDFGLVVGMNRLRKAYLELAPELEPYFSTGHHDDRASIMLSYGLSHRLSPFRVMGGTPTIVVAINTVLAGVIAAFTADLLGITGIVNSVIGIAIGAVTILGHAMMVSHTIQAGFREHHPRFPSEEKK